MPQFDANVSRADRNFDPVAHCPKMLLQLRVEVSAQTG
jgi:hypothetical protein